MATIQHNFEPLQAHYSELFRAGNNLQPGESALNALLENDVTNARLNRIRNALVDLIDGGDDYHFPGMVSNFNIEFIALSSVLFRFVCDTLLALDEAFKIIAIIFRFRMVATAKPSDI